MWTRQRLQDFSSLDKAAIIPMTRGAFSFVPGN